MNRALILLFALLPVIPALSQETGNPEFDLNEKSAGVIRANNSLGIGLLKTIVPQEDRPNVMISPVSVGIALGMTANGAESATREAFEQVLNYKGLTRQEVNEITRELIGLLITNTKGNLVEMANSIWTDKGYPVEESFLDINRAYYDARVEELDLKTSQALKTINQWVSDQTHGRIDKILEQVPPSTVMILINALYFNCLWEVAFDPEDTFEGLFHTEGGTGILKTPMMKVEGTFRASFTETFSAVELPYKNGKFSMVLFLPTHGMTVDQLISKLDIESWESWQSQFTEKSGFTVTMPKFKFEYQRSLADDLKAMGLKVAFSNSADFSSLTPAPVFVSDVVHKTFIEVNEKGTEAAAVTGVIITRASMGQDEIVLDRPFLFAIRENGSRSLVFLGKIGKPSWKDQM